MVDDLKKLMGKLQKDKKKSKIEKPDNEDVDEGDLVHAEEEETGDTDQKKEEQEKEAQQLIEHEVAVLQNNGIYRREVLGVLRELVDVHKVNTQTLLDLKKLVGGEDDKQ
jgi:hypothetical protein